MLFINNIRYCFGVTAAAALLGGFSAQAADNGWQVRLRGVNSFPRQLGNSDTLTVAGVAVANNAVRINDDLRPEVDLVYRIHRRFSAELSFLANNRDLNLRTGVGPLASGTKLMNTWMFSPTFALQYQLAPEARVRPYLGAGVNYTSYVNTETSSQVEAAFGPSRASMDDTWSWALQAGADVPLVDAWTLNFDIKYINLSSDLTLDTAAAGRIHTNLDIEPIVVGIGIGRRF